MFDALCYWRHGGEPAVILLESGGYVGGRHVLNGAKARWSHSGNSKWLIVRLVGVAGERKFFACVCIRMCVVVVGSRCRRFSRLWFQLRQFQVTCVSIIYLERFEMKIRVRRNVIDNWGENNREIVTLGFDKNEFLPIAECFVDNESLLCLIVVRRERVSSHKQARFPYNSDGWRRTRFENRKFGKSCESRILDDEYLVSSHVD